MHMHRSLPHRQLRNPKTRQEILAYGSLPHRQLRKRAELLWNYAV